MADYNLVDPQSGWEYDLHSVYAAYIGHFQHHGIDWWNKTWGMYFDSFDHFLEFGWPIVVITDVYQPHDAHIVTTAKHIHAFLKMIRTRFGEEFDLLKSITKIQPFETRRNMRHIDDISFYKKMYATLPGAALAARKERILSGDPHAIRELWNAKDKTFLAIDFEWSEKSPTTCLEFGYAALRSRHVASLGTWPPVPEDNYRLGHLVVSEHVDTIINKRFPTHPRSYSFGKSQFVSKKVLGPIVQTIVDSLASPDSDSQANELVLVAHGISGDLERLSDLKIQVPSNTIIIDTTRFERHLFRIGERPESIIDPHTSLSRQPGTSLSLSNLLRSFGVDISQFVFHNSGNDAFAALVSLQLLLEPDTQLKNLNRISKTEDELSPTVPNAHKDTPRSQNPGLSANGSGTSPGKRRVSGASGPPPPPVIASTGFAVEVPPKDTPAPPPVRGVEPRRGKGRGGGKKTATQQQQERDARLGNAMMNLDL